MELETPEATPRPSQGGHDVSNDDNIDHDATGSGAAAVPTEARTAHGDDKEPRPRQLSCVEKLRVVAKNRDYYAIAYDRERKMRIGLETELVAVRAELEDAKQAEWKLIASTDQRTMQANLLDDATFKKYPAGLKRALEHAERDLRSEQANNKAMRQMEPELRRREADLHQREADLHQREAELNQRETELHQREAELRTETLWCHVQRSWRAWRSR